SDPWKVRARWGSVPSVVSVLSLPSVPSIPSVSAMLKVALTGGIATGKSYVLNRFRHLGVPCLDADELAHGVEAAGTEATAAIAARVGAEGPPADGSVDRAKPGPNLVAHPAAPGGPEAIVHPPGYHPVAAG